VAAPARALGMGLERQIKICETCGRFRRYDPADTWCVGCGFETLSAACTCGRDFDYALDEPETGGLHCPRCGRDWRGARET
jgi:hypothetical protein